MANRTDTTIPLARLTSDPVLRAFFERSERDSGAAHVAPPPSKPKPPVTAARALELA